MNKNILFSIFAISGLLAVSSCDDFLNQEVTGIFDETAFYLTDEDAMTATTAVYDALSNTYSQVWSSLYLLKSIAGDDANAGGSDENDQMPYQHLDNFNYDSQNDFIRGSYNRLYTTVARANNIINRVEDTNDMRKRLIAESKFLRAYSYFELVSLWGDVPMPLQSVTVSEFTSTGRTPAEAVYEQIEEDLTDAIAVLPLKSAYGAADKFRASKGAAQALLGKVYLYQEKYALAAAILETVIDSDEYELENSVAAAFSRNNKFGKESLFEMNYLSTEGYNWDYFPWNTQESNIIVQLMGPREGVYVAAPGDSLREGWGFNTPTQKIWNAFVSAGDENRRKQTLMSVDELKALGGDWTENNLWDFENVIRRKYGTYITETTEEGGSTYQLNYATSFRIIRYADVLLMAAEANYRTDETKARGYLNQVRQRPGTALPAVSATGTALFDAIVLERQLELAFEGSRYPDLIRWGKAEQELSSLGFQAKHKLFPIPHIDVIGGNLEQNPGW